MARPAPEPGPPGSVGASESARGGQTDVASSYGVSDDDMVRAVPAGNRIRNSRPDIGEVIAAACDDRIVRRFHWISSTEMCMETGETVRHSLPETRPPVCQERRTGRRF